MESDESGADEETDALLGLEPVRPRMFDPDALLPLTFAEELPTRIDDEPESPVTQWVEAAIEIGKQIADFVAISQDAARHATEIFVAEGETEPASPIEDVMPESEEIDALTETPRGLLASVGRIRRRGAGGFAARMQKRSEERTESESVPVEIAPLEEEAPA